MVILAIVLFPPLGLLAARTAYRSRQFRGIDVRNYHILEARSRELAWAAVTTAITLAVLAAVAYVFLGNHFAVARAFVDPSYLRASIPSIGRGFVLNIKLAVTAECMILVWSLTIALLRQIPGSAALPLRWLCITYVDVIRGTPMLLILLIVTYGLPQSGIPILGRLPVFWDAAVAITLLHGAYVSEVLRSAIESIPYEQKAAARAIGLSYAQALRYVVVPQALRTITPPLLSWFIATLKDSSLVSIIGLLDSVNIARIAVINQSNLSPLAAAAILFIVTVIPLSRLADYLVARQRRRVTR